MATLTTYRLKALGLRWRALPARLRILVQVVAVVVTAGLAFLVIREQDGFDDSTTSLLVGVGLGVAAFLQNRQVERRQHTVELLSAMQTTDTLCAADRWMAARISSGEPVLDTIDAESDQQVMTLLDYYEFLCVLGERGHLDSALLADLRGSAMERSLSTCRRYVDDRRLRVGDELYRRFEAFVTVTLPARQRFTRPSPAFGPEDAPTRGRGRS